MLKMKMRNLLFLLVASLTFAACQGGANSAKKPGDVPYTKAQHYFVNNTCNESGVKKITSQNEFDAIFGMAPVMGEGGAPTAIDFSKSYVIAIIGDVSNRTPEIQINSLKQIDGKIEVGYSINDKEETTYSTKPCAILIVDNEYQGEVKAV